MKVWGGGGDQLKIVWKVGFQFFKSRFFCVWKQFVVVSIFQEPALHVSKPFRMVSIFFKKWRFTPQNCLLRVVSIFQKSALRASVPSAAVPIFSKAGDSRRKSTVCCFLKNKTLRKSKHYYFWIQFIDHLCYQKALWNAADKWHIRPFTYLLKIDLMNHTHILDEYLLQQILWITCFTSKALSEHI